MGFLITARIFDGVVRFLYLLMGLADFLVEMATMPENWEIRIIIYFIFRNLNATRGVYKSERSIFFIPKNDNFLNENNFKNVKSLCPLYCTTYLFDYPSKTC